MQSDAVFLAGENWKKVSMWKGYKAGLVKLPWASRDFLQLALVRAETVELWPLQNLTRNFCEKKKNKIIRGLFDKSSKIYSSLNQTLIWKTILEDSVSLARWKKSGFPWICVLWSSSLTHFYIPILYILCTTASLGLSPHLQASFLIPLLLPPSRAPESAFCSWWSLGH